MNSIKHKIMKNMTNEQKTLFLLKIPYINLFKLQKTYKQNINLIGGNPKDKKDKQNNDNNFIKRSVDYDKEYNKEYCNDTGINMGINMGNFYIEIDKNKYYYRVERYSTGEGTKYEDMEIKFIDFITIKDEHKGFVDCVSLSIDIKKKIATITSLGNSTKCLKSKNNVEFKYGDI
jgi:hypothetical protein